MGPGDRLDQGEAQAEPVVVGAVRDAGERLEQPLDLTWGNDRSGVHHADLAAPVRGAGRDGDAAPREVVPRSVVEQVPHEPFEQYRVTEDRGLVERRRRL